jgi:hypothetical protein
MSKRNTGLRRCLLAGGVTVGLLAGSATAAWAGQTGDPAGNGYKVEVHVDYSGDAAPADRHQTPSIKAACWWSPVNGDYQDAVKMLAWYQAATGGVQSPGMVATYGPIQIWQDAADQARAGHPMSWYMAYCVSAKDLANFGLGQVPIVDPVNGQTFGYYMYQAFPGGGAPPAPLVDPADLAAAARDAMNILDPLTHHNPTIASHAAGEPALTLVGLPTWFWVRDPDEIGGAAGTRFIRADIAGSNIWAEVTARTDGLSISSSVGSATCTPSQALVAYAKGVKEGSACTVSFGHAAAANQVTVSTAWAATWRGSDGNGGALDGRNAAVTVNVPVAEVQNINTN